MKKYCFLFLWFTCLYFAQDAPIFNKIKELKAIQNQKYQEIQQVLSKPITDKFSAIEMYSSLSAQLSTYFINEHIGHKVANIRGLSSKNKETALGYFDMLDDDIVGEVNAVVLDLDEKYQIDFWEFFSGYEKAILPDNLMYYRHVDYTMEKFFNENRKAVDKKLDAIELYETLQYYLKTFKETWTTINNKSLEFEIEQMDHAYAKTNKFYQKIMQLK